LRGFTGAIREYVEATWLERFIYTIDCIVDACVVELQLKVASQEEREHAEGNVGFYFLVGVVVDGSEIHEGLDYSEGVLDNFLLVVLADEFQRWSRILGMRQ
jgi:hypothetical protein